SKGETSTGETSTGETSPIEATTTITTTMEAATTTTTTTESPTGPTTTTEPPTGPTTTTTEPPTGPPTTTTTEAPTTTTTTTTERPFAPTFRCDFATPCFGNGELIISDGTDFIPTKPIATSEPPRAPVSGATSVTKPTNNGLLCNLPYQPSEVVDGNTTTTNWDMWFCYNHQCPTSNGQTAECIIDYYGLTSLEPSETMKTVTDSLIPNVMARDASGDQCLRFYYYFTVYDGSRD
ncbi:unnamed protein product, partial [Adineta steineri]